MSTCKCTHVFWWDAAELLYVAAQSHCSKLSNIQCFEVQDINFFFQTLNVFFVFYLVLEPVDEHLPPIRFSISL